MNVPTPSLRAASQSGPVEIFWIVASSPQVPNDEPLKIHTHLTDSEAQADVEGRHLFRPTRRR